MRVAKIGIIGCGAISGIYFESQKVFKNIQITACADLDIEKARQKAAEVGNIRACTVEELLADPEIEIVLNLTIPAAHSDVAMASLNAGKSVYGEKPLAVELNDGRRILETARAKGLHVGCAPDTFLGGAHQSARRLIDDGKIGAPVAATAFMLGHGPETWHPNPEFYYQPGGGPMFDMGPYYLTALINMMGPVRRVAGMTGKAFAERQITSKPKAGKVFKVEVPTHVMGLLEFHSGAIGTIITSFDVWHSDLPRIEVHGTEGSMSVPDPNNFGGPVRLWHAGDKEWSEAKSRHGYNENSRGIGVADMACALKSGRAHRASGELAFHVLEIMHALHEASDTRRHVTLKSKCERPKPMVAELLAGVLEE